MNFLSIIPLAIFSVSLFISLNTDVKTLDGIPSLIAPCLEIISLVWLFAIIPWLLKTGCIILLICLGKIYLPSSLKMSK